MLIKLLATSIVASSFLGLFKSFVIIDSDLDTVKSSGSKSVLVSENKATSAPEISAEHSNSINNSKKLETIEKPMVEINNIIVGSGSNIYS